MTVTSAQPSPALKTLLIGELVGLSDCTGEQRNDLTQKRDILIHNLLAMCGGTEIDKTDGFLLMFDRPGQAVHWALSYIQKWRESPSDETAVLPRFGLHLGEVYLRTNNPEDVERGAKPLEVEGLAKPMTARLMVLAQGNQILMTRGAFDIARRAAQDEDKEQQPISWLAHGGFLFKGMDEPVDVFEVGVIGLSPLSQPPDTKKAKKASGETNIVGWRPAQAQEVPHRHHWFLDRKLGEGGFGEVWLAKHAKTTDLRVFKFCFEKERLKGLQREVTLFRLLKIGLGNRDDITRILDWNFDEAPYFIESQYTKGGNLKDWIAKRGGLEHEDLNLKCQLAAQIAEALSAAHSVGILHKDIKPANVLIQEKPDHIQAQLTDFGIGMLEDRDRLQDANITALGFTRTVLDEDYSGGGTQKYMAPELLEGLPASHQSDLFALGVLIYQLFCNSFSKAIGPGWEREIDHFLVREDLAKLVDKNPANRPTDAKEVSLWFRHFERRAEERLNEQRAKEEAEQAKRDLERNRKRRKLISFGAIVFLVFGITMAFQANRIAHEAARANQEAKASREIADFMTGVFKVSDPSQGGQVTAQELLDHSASDLPRKLADQPRIQARLSEAIGTAYLNLGRFAEAEALLGQARIGYERLYGPSSLEMLGLNEKRGVLLGKTGQVDQGLNVLKKVLQKKQALFTPNSKELISIYQSLYETCDTNGRFGEALPYKRELDRLLALWDKGSPLDPTKPSQMDEPLALIREVDLPPDITRVLGSGPYPGTVLAAGVTSLYVINLQQNEPIKPLALQADERPLGMLKNGMVVLVRNGHVLLRNFFDSNSSQDALLYDRLESSDRLIFNDSGSRFAICSESAIRTFTVEMGKLKRNHKIPMKRAAAPIYCLTENHLGYFDISMNGEGVHIYDLRTEREVLTANDWHGRPYSLSIDDLTGQVLIAGWFDEIFVYQIRHFEPKIIQATHKKKGAPLRFPDHTTYALGGEEYLTLVNTQNGHLLTHKRSGSELEPVEYGPAGLLVLDRTKRSLLQFRYFNCPIDEQIPVSNTQIWATTASDDGRFIFTGSADGSLQQYDRKENRLDSFIGHTQGVTAIQVLPSSDPLEPPWVVSASDDKSLILWDQSTRSIKNQTKAHNFLINELYWENQKQMLWSASSDHFIKGWSLPDFKEQISFQAGQTSNADIWINSQKGKALVGAWGGAWLSLVRENGKWNVKRKVETGCRGIYKLVELKEMNLVLMMGLDPETIWLYDLERDLAWRLKTPELAYSCATAVGIDTVALGGWGVALYRFERKDHKIKYQVRVHLNTEFGLLTGAGYSPDGNSLAFGTYRGDLVMLDLPSNQTLPLIEEWLQP